MKKSVVLLFVSLILILPSKLKAQGSNNDVFSETGQVYVNNFDDLTGLILNETAGTVTSEPIIGTHTPQVLNALTLEHTSAGSVTASVDLGQTYNKLYVQYYFSIIDQSTASNYTNNFEVGQAVESLESAQILMRHNFTENQFSIFGQSAGGFKDFNIDSTFGAWNLIGMEIDRVALTVSFYLNRKLIATISCQNRDLRYITMGGTGNGSTSYKVQYTGLTVNTLGFQDIINNTNGVGDYISHFVDYSIESNTNYNGVDLSALDKNDWTGLHSEPFDPDGGTNYIDGPASYLNDVGTNDKGKLVYATRADSWFVKRGVRHKLEDLSSTNKISFTGASTFGNAPTLEPYGSGTMPVLDASIIADDSAWFLYDTVNNIYSQPLTASANCAGVWEEDNGLALREVFNLAWMTNASGCWFADGTNVYVRLWDDSDPTLKEISIGTNQRPTFMDFTEIRGIHFRHANILCSDGMIVENCEFSKSSGASVTNSTFRDNKLYDLWGGTDYGSTATNSPAGQGYGKSGDGGGIGVNENALVYRNTIDDAYLAVNINTEAHDAVFAFNKIKNTVVNSITVSGNGNGDPSRPSIIANNTVFCGGRHKDNNPYPLVRPQPNHGFVHQNGGGGAFIFVNNLMLLHYNQNDEFSLQNENSTTNIMSFVTNSLSIAVGKMGFNKFYRTPISNSPATIFGQGGGVINAWSTTMAAAGNFRDLDGISNPDSTSEVVNILPVTEAEYTETSGKWLSTNATPTELGGGYYIDYASYGITTDLVGNPLGTNLSIGALSGIAPETTYIFNGTWSPSDPNGVASESDEIIITSGNATIDSNTTCDSATINPGSSLAIGTGIILTTNSLALKSTSTSYSSLILDGTVTGTLTYERHVNINGSGTTGSNDLISAPLTGQAFNAFASANPNILNNGTLYLFGHFDKVVGDYVTYAGSATTPLNAGIGYRAASSDNGTFIFTGTANYGTVTYDITNGGPTEPEWNLVGNPYPSYLNVQAFLNHEVSTGVSNIDLFDTGTAAIYGYDGDALDDWIIYNLANTTAYTVIAPGQGFFVSADATNAPLYDLEFTPAMRSTGTSDDFIAGRNDELIFVKLNASTSSNSYATDFYFNSNSSLGFDLGYDAAIWGETVPDFAIYSHLVQDNNGAAITLQSLNSANLSDVTIPLGVNANQGEQLTFSIADMSLPASVNVYLDDVVANTSTLLNNSDYVITPTIEFSGTGRFFLRTSEDALSEIDNSFDTLNIFALNATKELVISGQLQNNSVLSIYDIQGRNVLTTQLDNTNIKNRINVSTLSGGVYFATVFNNNQIKIQKLVIN